ncbi:MAG TPA: hypothetical protein VLH58_03150 [Candidatus Methylomirabilis sp.]|nr:hypothetical protein [Candidatus Methylomirabilis sp.]HSC70319.1 hypothetical protein [Candidatus Methylomirabilis sp.]
MRHLVTAMLLATLLAGSIARAEGSADTAIPAQSNHLRLAASGDAGPRIIFLQDGRTIQADGSERLGDRIRIETPTSRIELPSSRVLSIHPMDAPAASPASLPPAEVYRGLTQQMVDQVRGQLQGQTHRATAR